MSVTHTKTTDWSDLKRLAEAATPGPWHSYRNHLTELYAIEGEDTIAYLGYLREEDHRKALFGNDKANAAFIVALVNAWPKVLELIAENEQKATELYEFKLLITAGEDAPGHAGTLTVSEAEALLRGRHRQSVEEAVALKAEIAALKAQRDEMAEALGECEEVLALSEHTPLRDPAYHDRVKALGREIGFGAMMAIAERAWREVLEEKGYSVGSEHTAGACRSTVDATLRRAREALRNARTGEDHD